MDDGSDEEMLSHSPACSPHAIRRGSLRFSISSACFSLLFFFFLQKKLEPETVIQPIREITWENALDHVSKASSNHIVYKKENQT